MECIVVQITNNITQKINLGDNVMKKKKILRNTILNLITHCSHIHLDKAV